MKFAKIKILNPYVVCTKLQKRVGPLIGGRLSRGLSEFYEWPSPPYWLGLRTVGLWNLLSSFDFHLIFNSSHFSPSPFFHYSFLSTLIKKRAIFIGALLLSGHRSLMATVSWGRPVFGWSTKVTKVWQNRFLSRMICAKSFRPRAKSGEIGKVCGRAKSGKTGKMVLPD